MLRLCAYAVPSLALDPLGQEVSDFDGEGGRRVKVVDGLVRKTLDHLGHVHPLSHDGRLHTSKHVAGQHLLLILGWLHTQLTKVDSVLTKQNESTKTPKF